MLQATRSEDPTRTEDASLVAIQERVRGFVRRLVANPDDREEVVSQTLLALLEQQRGRRLRRPDAWALRVAWNKVADLRRRQGRAPGQDADVASLTVPDPQRSRELREWLEAGLAELEDGDRALLHLRYAEEMADRDIARILSCPRGTVARRLHDARRRLAAVLERLGGGVTVAMVLTLLGVLGNRTRAASVATSAATAGTIAGVLAMKKVAAVVLAVVALGFFAWKLQDEDPSPSGRGAPPAGVVSEQDAPPHDAPDPVETADAAVPLTAAPFEERPSPGSRRIQGRVETAEGSPVAGARVSAFVLASGVPLDLDDEEAPLFRATTDCGGRFAIPAASAGRMGLVARTEDHAPGVLWDVQGKDDVVITLPPAFTLRGRVVDLQGEPVQGALVAHRSLLGTARLARTVRSDADGCFVLRGIPDPASANGSHLFVDAAGYAPRRKPLNTAPLDEEVVVHLSRGAVVEGRVTAAGAPVEDAEVVLWTFEDPAPSMRTGEGVWIRNPFGSRILLRTRTDGDGRFRLDRVPVEIADINPLPSMRSQMPDHTGTVLGGVVAWKTGHAPASAPVRMPEHEQEMQSIELALHPPGRLFGRVVDQDGVPMPGVRVRVTPGEPKPVGFFGMISYTAPGNAEPFGPWSEETDAEGRWRFEHVPCPDGAPLACTITCCGCPLGLGKDVTQQCEVLPGERIEVPDLVFDARRVHGRVVDAAGDPVEGACVARNGITSLPGAFSDRTGAFVLWIKLAERSRKTAVTHLQVTAPSRRTAVVPIPEDWSPVTVVLEPGAAIRGRLLHDDGSPARDLVLLAWPAGEAEPQPHEFRHRTTTDPTGAFFIDGLAPGAYIVATHPNQPTWQATVQTDGPPVQAILPTPEKATFPLALRILDAADRTPVAGRVTALPARGQPHLHTRGATARGLGLYAFTALEAGIHTVTVDAKGYMPVQKQVHVGPESQEEAIEILLGGGARLSGNVHFPPGITAHHRTKVSILSPDGRKVLAGVDVAPDHTYAIAGLPAGPILLRADAPALGRGAEVRPSLTVPRMTPLVATDAPLVWHLDLIPAARLDLSFTGPSGEADSRPSIAAAARPKTPSREYAVLDGEGNPWSFKPLGNHTDFAEFLPPGTYVIEVRSKGVVLSSTRVTAPGKTTIPMPDP